VVSRRELVTTAECRVSLLSTDWTTCKATPWTSLPSVQESGSCSSVSPPYESSESWSRVVVVVRGREVTPSLPQRSFGTPTDRPRPSRHFERIILHISFFSIN